MFSSFSYPHSPFSVFFSVNSMSRKILKCRSNNFRVPVDPLEWQISQDTASNIVARLANTVGAAESVLRVAATGHHKRLFVKVVICLYFLAALGRIISGVTIAYAAFGKDEVKEAQYEVE
ncbi:unnamed protein product [Arabis nemorensis]|uniref:Reticulon domain-containing protein n=1 Tax=Arabis nemorensis TaxID=586526 RepID=A0A565AQ88_9BRAS|nr:unnamed protein product [Arabis nemorensis]